jgi:hypothetical protein
MREKLMIIKEHVVKWYSALTKKQRYLFYLLTFNVVGSTFNTIMSYFNPAYFDAKIWGIALVVSIGFMYRFVLRTARKQKVVKFGKG